ncbi:MAG: HPF/RaiA family ribosome-associated protein [Candidatus Acidiferrales bacterium]
MKTSLTFKYDGANSQVEAELSRYLAKLEKFLTHYDPDLAQLHGSFDKHPRKTEYSCSLTLSLPTGAMHSTGVGPDVHTSVKKAVTVLASQLKKHQSRLRKDYQWKRKRPRGAAAPDGEPSRAD